MFFVFFFSSYSNKSRASTGLISPWLWWSRPAVNGSHGDSYLPRAEHSDLFSKQQEAFLALIKYWLVDKRGGKKHSQKDIYNTCQHIYLPEPTRHVLNLEVGFIVNWKAGKICWKMNCLEIFLNSKRRRLTVTTALVEPQSCRCSCWSSRTGPRLVSAGTSAWRIHLYVRLLGGGTWSIEHSPLPHNCLCADERRGGEPAWVRKPQCVRAWGWSTEGFSLLPPTERIRSRFGGNGWHSEPESRRHIWPWATQKLHGSVFENSCSSTTHVTPRDERINTSPN